MESLLQDDGGIGQILKKYGQDIGRLKREGILSEIQEVERILLEKSRILNALIDQSPTSDT